MTLPDWMRAVGLRRVLAWGLFSLAGAALAGEPLRVTVSASWSMPVAQVEGERLSNGLMRDFYQELGRALGRPVVYVVLPRKRLDAAVLAGDVELRCYLNPKWTDIPEQMVWSKPLFEMANVVVGRHDVPRPATVDALPAGARISTVLGYRYPVLDPAFAVGRLQRDESTDEERVLLKLSAGRTHYGVALDLAVDWYRRTARNHQLADWRLETERIPIHCAVPRQPDGRHEALLKAVHQMVGSGKVEEMLRRYR